MSVHRPGGNPFAIAHTSRNWGAIATGAGVKVGIVTVLVKRKVSVIWMNAGERFSDKVCRPLA